MIWLILLAIIIALIVGLVWLRQSKKTEPSAPAEELNLDRLDVGGVVLIQSIEYFVEQKNRYASNGEEWFELKLSGMEGETSWLGWQTDIPVNANPTVSSITLTQEIDFDQLNLPLEELAQFSQNQSGRFDYEETIYYLSRSGEDCLYENCHTRGESFYFWDFEDEEHEKVISVQQWGQHSYEASIGHFIRPSEVDIYSTSGSIS